MTPCGAGDLVACHPAFRHRLHRALPLLAALLLTAPSPLDARITKIAIASRSPAFNGQSFGAAGQFEKIKGIASGEIECAPQASFAEGSHAGFLDPDRAPVDL